MPFNGLLYIRTALDRPTVLRPYVHVGGLSPIRPFFSKAPDAAAAEIDRNNALRDTGFKLKDLKRVAALTGTGMRLDIVASFDNGSSWIYEVKTLAFCPSNYGTKWKDGGK